MHVHGGQSFPPPLFTRRTPMKKKEFQAPALKEESSLDELTLFQSISGGGSTCGANCV